MPEGLMEQVTLMATTYGFRLLGAIAVLFVGSLVAKAIRRGVRKALTARNVDATLIPFVSNMLYYLLMAFVVIAVLGLFGVEVASIIAVMGAAAFAVGLALQGTLSNFAAGIMLLVFRPFRVGDVVEIGGAVGSVLEIGVFSTHLNTADNVRIIMPNGQVWGSMIKNYASNDTRRIDLVIGVGYEDNLEQAMSILNQVLEADERVLREPAWTVAVSELGDSSVNFVVRPWCTKEDYWALRFDLTRAIKEQLEAGGCSIPFPQRDVHLIQAAGGTA